MRFYHQTCKLCKIKSKLLPHNKKVLFNLLPSVYKLIHEQQIEITEVFIQ